MRPHSVWQPAMPEQLPWVPQSLMACQQCSNPVRCCVTPTSCARSHVSMQCCCEECSISLFSICSTRLPGHDGVQKVACRLLQEHFLNCSFKSLMRVFDESLLWAHTPDQGWMWLFGSVTKPLSFSWMYTGALNSSAQVAMPPKKCGCETAMARMPPLPWICLAISGCSTLMQSHSMLPSSAGLAHVPVKVSQAAYGDPHAAAVGFVLHYPGCSFSIMLLASKMTATSVLFPDEEDLSAFLAHLGQPWLSEHSDTV